VVKKPMTRRLKAWKPEVVSVMRWPMSQENQGAEEGHADPPRQGGLVALDAEKARAEHEIGLPGRHRRQQLRDEGRIVLAVAVHLHQKIVAMAQGVLVAGLDRHPVAHVEGVRNHLAPAAALLGGVVPGAVVDDQDVEFGGYISRTRCTTAPMRKLRCTPE
jgi:hypothetical protein